MNRSAGRREFLRGVAVAIAAVVTFAAPLARADSLASAKASGSVGERTNGTLGLVDANAPAEIVQLVEQVNRKRSARYTEIATKNGTTASAVAALAGKKAIEKTAPGNYIQNAHGDWVKK